MAATMGNGIIRPMTIKRDLYLDRLVRSKGDGFVKIVTGIRRCGKRSPRVSIGGVRVVE